MVSSHQGSGTIALPPEMGIHQEKSLIMAFELKDDGSLFNSCEPQEGLLKFSHLRVAYIDEAPSSLSSPKYS